MVDSKLLARFSFILTAFVALIVVGGRATINAQYGACPSSTIMMAPNPIGSYRDDMALCREAAVTVRELELRYDTYPGYPCDGQFIDRPNQIIATTWYNHVRVLTVSPPYYQYLGDRARIRFILFNSDYQFYYTGVIQDPFLEDGAKLHIQSGNPVTGQVLDYVYDIAPLPMVLGIHPRPIGQYYYQAYFVDVVIDNWEDYGGFYNIFVQWHSPRDLAGGAWTTAYGIASLQIGNEFEPFPTHCQVPGASLPQTPTPTPVGTVAPTPTGTRIPTRTPDPASPTPTLHTTPYPTAQGGTPLPTRTLAPPVINTIPPEATPSPYPNVVLPTVAFPTLSTVFTPTQIVIPTISFPTIEAAEVPDVPTPGEGPDWTGIIELLNNGWITDTGAIVSSLDPAVTDTTVISSPNQIAAVMAGSVGVPVSYAKSVSYYMPNTWPYILIGLGFFGWILFNTIARFVLNNLGKILEIVRRIIELIPGL